METPDPGIDALVQQAVRRELNRVARRYVPIIGGAVAFALIVALVPTVDERNNSSDRGLRASAGQTQNDSTDAGATTEAAAGDATNAPAGPAADGAVAPGGSTGGSTGGTRGRTTAPGVPAGITPPATPGAPGVARSGVSCGKNVRQVPWSVYAPLCTAAFSGNNGGATSHGVTKDTITITYRRGQSTQDTAVYAAAGDAAPAPDDMFLADMRDYINLFNRTYELYGRKVVLKDFQGQGDYIQEDMGQGQAAAAADAATVRDLGAFADLTFLLKGSQPFWTGLAQQKVVAIGPLGFPQSYFERNAPYWYSAAPNGSKGASFLGNLVCRRMAGMPAIFAGDPAFRTKTRSFGLVTPENPEYLAVANEIAANLKKCGVTITRRASYAINVATFQAQATNIVAGMKSAGVTTLMCFCDPLVPIFLSQSADQQSYRPEWTEPWYRDPQGRLQSQQQWAHAMSNNGKLPAREKSEAYRVFKLANPKAEPRQQYYDVAYVSLLMLFNGLQAAGPNVTPRTFERGYQSLPTSLPGGDAGTWSYGPKTYDPQFDTQIGWWNPNGKSVYDNKTGTWEDCDGGKRFPYLNQDAWGPPRTQLKCFGR